MANTHSLTSALAGANLSSSDGTTARFRLGTRALGAYGTEWVYCIASGAITAYQLVGINEDYDAFPMTSALSVQSDMLGFAQYAIASSAYAWIPVRGANIKVRTKASAVADTQLWTTASAGVVDDATAAGALKIDGVVLVSSASTAANGAAGIEVKAAFPALRES